MASTDWLKIGRRGLTSFITPLGKTADGYNYTGLPSGTHTDSADENRFVGQTQPIYYGAAIVGETQSLQTVAGRINVIKPTGVGEAYIETNPVQTSGNSNPEQVLSQRTNSIITSVSGTTVQTYYKMQGYYVTGAVYETWVAIGAPNLTPPSGHSLINISVVGKWSQ